MFEAEAERGPVVVVTGAASGIGRATALRFAEDNAQLVLASRDVAALERLVAECESCGARAIAVRCDVTSDADVLALVEAACEFGDGIDAWVNNAGVGVVGEFDTVPFEAHRRVIETDLVAYARGAHAVLPVFRAQGQGLLVNVLSLGSWVPQPLAASYSAAKFGLRGLSAALRGELGRDRDIHVCDVYPAFVDTPAFGYGGNYSGHEVRPPSPAYDPRRVAQAIVRLTRRPRATTVVGGVAPLARAAYALVPRFEVLSAALTRRALARMPEAPPSPGNLFESVGGRRRVDGGYRTPVPAAVRTAGIGAGLAAVAGLAWLGYRAMATRR